ncbi:zinc ABC transporter substrate-binding protein [Jiella avicenniae]|uniref:High-affinity zinc uptake system protein ZnuA n=1 Tax=Jiella avicenniae TaxID=2907202 RepID=A0A9X1TDI1_9HYPH|nr:zinc ABC transporter substrate-binding protein [Jiella avicenniae]MCE7030148.1 zinc ABC transporter substrate-binding protein [Jiella avicenniae]
MPHPRNLVEPVRARARTSGRTRRGARATTPSAGKSRPPEAGGGFLAAKAFVAALIAGLALASQSAEAQEAPKVVASIKPVESLVSAVMQGVGKPHLIVEGAASPHTAALKPSDASALSEAQAIFWIGPQLENFLVKPIGSLGSDARIVPLWDAEGVEKLKARSGAMFEPDDDHDHGTAEDDHEKGASHEHEAGESADHDHDHGESGVNEHVWLDPENAVAMTKAIAATLSDVDPAHAATYRANADAYVERLKTLEEDVRAKLQDAPKKPFVVFHDAYQYFEERFGVPAAGAITVSPERAPGAARIREIKDKLESVGAACVFTEPEFEPSIVATVTEGTSATVGVLDPLGADLQDGPDLYPTLIGNIAQGLSDCFRRQ